MSANPDNGDRSDTGDRPDSRRVIDTLQLIATPSRLDILAALRDAPDGRLRVSEIIAAIGATSQPSLSHQLKMLAVGGLIRGRREGQRIFYEIDPAGFAGVARLVASFAGFKAGEPSRGNGKGSRNGRGRREAVGAAG